MSDTDSPPYPEVAPFNEETLKLDNTHTLFFQQYGTPDGIPVVVLHGGPGGGLSTKNARFFDPKKYNVILYDQRGCGRSKPTRELKNNTTKHLIEDLEILRKHLNIEQWIIKGSSWGSTLALAYGQTYPEHCLGFILRGVFLGTKEETLWPETGARMFHPEAWETFVKAVDLDEAKPLMDQLFNKTDNPDVAIAYCDYEYTLCQFMPLEEEEKDEALKDMLHTLGSTMIYYMNNNCFLEPGQLLKNMGKIKHLPAQILQGRYDMVCPPIHAYNLHKAWDGSELTMIPDAGHSGSILSAELATTKAIEKITKEITKKG